MTTVGLDLATRVFQVHDAAGNVVLRKALRRLQVPFFTKLPPCLICMEACGTPITGRAS